MKYIADEYFVKGRQLEKLEEELEKVEAFHKLMTNRNGGVVMTDDEAEFSKDDLSRTYDQFSQALRELKYLVEDISGQVLAVFEG